jgi:hypothetical protein
MDAAMIRLQQLLDTNIAPASSKTVLVIRIPKDRIVVSGPLTITRNYVTLQVDGRLQARDLIENVSPAS